MRLRTLVLVVIIVLVFVIPYSVYAMDYKGNYNVSVTTRASVDSLGAFSATTPQIDCDATDMWDFWGLLKGHGTDRPDYGYMVYLEITRAGVLVGFDVTTIRLNATESIDIILTADNVSPGEADVRVYFVDVMTDTIVYDKTIDGVIP